MQPASSGGGATKSRSLRKWGPVAALVAVAAVVIGVIVVAGGGDDDGADDTAAPVTTTGPADTDAPDTGAPDTSAPDSAPDTGAPDTGSPPVTGGGEVTFPLSFSEAQDQGIEVAWDERCNTETGYLAVRDFFAPECYAPFEGDNGGATAPGVTADSIKIVLYQGPEEDPIINYITDAIAVEDTNQQQADTVRGMLEYYDVFYEWYGRKVDLVVYESTGIANDEVTARADAIAIAEMEPFAVLDGPDLTPAFADELAANGVLCVSCTPGQADSWYAERDPYVWGLAIGARQARAHAREMVAKQLVGKNAEHAGDPAFQETPRKFGVVYIESGGDSKDVTDEFVAGLRDDGADIAEVLPYQLDPATIQASAAQIIAKLKASGVTSVLFIGDPIAPRDFTREATAQEYFPEWILAAAPLADITAFARTYDQQQWAHAFGVTQVAARLMPEISGYYALYQWFHGEPPPAKDTIGVVVPPMATMAAVLQITGPNLTAQNWRDALYGRETLHAISAPFLSWGENLWPDPDYSGVDDSTMIWWDPTVEGPDEIRRDGVGMYQYVDGGTRYLPGEWPTEERYFDPEGAVTIYEEPPPGEEPPDYPSPAG